LRIFKLIRDVDVSGVSGTGVVAEGIEFSDGSVAIRWLSRWASTVTWASVHDAMHVHGHDGLTRLEWGGTVWNANTGSR
jgi:hypothetical protein